MLGLTKAAFIAILNRIHHFPDDVVNYLYEIYRAMFLRAFDIRRSRIMSFRPTRDDYNDDDEHIIPLRPWRSYGPGF